MLLLGASAIEELLPLAKGIEVVEQAMRALSRGQVLAPLRTVMPLAQGNAMGIMPGALLGEGCFGLKVLALYPGNGAQGLPSHGGMVLLFDAATGAPTALLESHSLTALRTAAASAVATRALARPGSAVLALLGTGHQALWHARALCQVMPLRRLQLWNHRRAGAWKLAARLGALAGVEVVVVDSAREAVQGADVVCTVTAAREPILQGAWLERGQHVNLVGASVASAREADDAVVARSRYFVDAVASAQAQAGEWLHALQSGAVEPAHLQGEIGAVLLGELAGRRSADEITVYKSLGHTAQDLATANALVRLARASGRHPEMDW